MVDIARAKLVTIIASAELQDRLEHDLRSLGAGGYSVTRVDGRGRQGPRIRGLFEIGNVRIETIVAPAAAEGILTHLARQAETKDIVAFSQDVDAIPRRHFV
jgi:nitrogen regulatory protein PII